MKSRIFVSRGGLGAGLFLASCLFCTSGALSPPSPTAKRPKISKIAYVRILVSDKDAASRFYSALSLAAQDQPCVWCETRSENSPPSLAEQIALIKDGGSSPKNRLDEVVFEVSDAKKMRDYLAENGMAIRSAEDQVGYLDVLDPEQHRIGFIEKPELEETAKKSSSPPPVIHAGFIVRKRAAMEHFYKDLLGFRPYWHGGMKDDQTDWISLQVPDGTDWVEFMVSVPENADQRVRGIMNHIALGVTDIHATREQLIKNGLHLSEEPKLGRDGKWQLNVYDPDQTRIEFMEFTPKEKPCCSEFTGPHPKP